MNTDHFATLAAYNLNKNFYDNKINSYRNLKDTLKKVTVN